MPTVSNSEGDEHKPGHDGAETPPVHADVGVGIAKVGRNSEKAQGGNGGHDASADPEVPAPVEQLARGGADQNADIEADAGAGAVDAEDEVLPWARAVDTAEEGDAGR